MRTAPQEQPWLWQDVPPVHLWQIPLDISAERLAERTPCLSADEHARAGRVLSPQDRRRFQARRSAVRTILAGYLGTAPHALRFSLSPYGKPTLAGETLLHFNLTHSEDLALLAVSAGPPVGIDLERLRTDFAPEPLAARFFAPAEQEALRLAPPEEQHRLYWAIWTAKEAALKALGTGLTRPLNSFAVSLETQTHTLPTPLRLRALFPAPGFAAALAIAD